MSISWRNCSANRTLWQEKEGQETLPGRAWNPEKRSTHAQVHWQCHVAGREGRRRKKTLAPKPLVLRHWRAALLNVWPVLGHGQGVRKVWCPERHLPFQFLCHGAARPAWNRQVGPNEFLHVSADEAAHTSQSESHHKLVM